MIFVRDKGRMCNNILQYAHVYAWAREHGRSVLSMRFSYKYQHFRLCHERKHNFLSYLIGKYGAKCGILPTISFMNPEDEGSEELEQRMLSANHFMLEGWYVRFYDLFLKYKREITEMFSFNDDITNKVQTYISETAKADDIRLGVHIRRGDYKTFKGGKYFYSDEQYQSVIRAFCQLHPDKHVTVYICTNDMQLNRDAYRQALSGCCTIADMIKGDGDVLDLCLLSNCHYIIGAPSTYSLVAAMYNDTPLLWLHEATPAIVADQSAWSTFNTLFRHII